MSIKHIEISRLKPAEYNFREMTEVAKETLKNSLMEFGLVETIVWNERTGNIVGGHQRFNILKEMGVTHLPCYVVNLEETDERILNKVLNSAEASGQYDSEKTIALIAELEGKVPDLVKKMRIREIESNFIKQDWSPRDGLEEMSPIEDSALGVIRVKTKQNNREVVMAIIKQVVKNGGYLNVQIS